MREDRSRYSSSRSLAPGIHINANLDSITFLSWALIPGRFAGMDGARSHGDGTGSENDRERERERGESFVIC